MANDPSLLRPLQDAYIRWQAALQADGVDPVIGTLVRLVADGLWFSSLVGAAPIKPMLLRQLIAKLVRQHNQVLHLHFQNHLVREDALLLVTGSLRQRYGSKEDAAKQRRSERNEAERHCEDSDCVPRNFLCRMICNLQMPSQTFVCDEGRSL